MTPTLVTFAFAIEFPNASGSVDASGVMAWLRAVIHPNPEGLRTGSPRIQDRPLTLYARCLPPPALFTSASGSKMRRLRFGSSRMW